MANRWLPANLSLTLCKVAWASSPCLIGKMPDATAI